MIVLAGGNYAGPEPRMTGSARKEREAPIGSRKTHDAENAQHPEPWVGGEAKSTRKRQREEGSTFVTLRGKGKECQVGNQDHAQFSSAECWPQKRKGKGDLHSERRSR